MKGIIIVILTGALSMLYAQKPEVIKELPPDAPLVETRESQELTPLPPQAKVQLSDEDIARIYQFLSQIDPSGPDQLREIQMKDRNRYEHKLQKLYREMLFMDRLKHEQPERYAESVQLRKLSRQSAHLAELFRNNTDESEKNKIKQELTLVLDQLFDLREKEKQEEIKRIKTHLKQLQNQIAERKKNKQLIIQNRLDQLTGKGNLYEW